MTAITTVSPIGIRFNVGGLTECQSKVPTDTSTITATRAGLYGDWPCLTFGGDGACRYPRSRPR